MTGKGGLPLGLYESLITTAVAAGLESVDSRLVERSGLHRAEAANRVALHLSRQIERALGSVPDGDRVEVAVELVRTVLEQLSAMLAKSDLGSEVIVAPAAVLRAISAFQPDGSVRQIPVPLIPLLDTTLLTNAPDEPGVGHQIRTEVGSAQSVDVVMAFVRMTGILPMRNELRRHCAEGGQLRVLTTTYTGSTEAKALDLLVGLGADVRVSYDETTTRLHAKAWLFNRPTGFSTAYIGSSNLTHSAHVSGLEWNVRVSSARNPDVIDKMRAVFESYWESADFLPYDPVEFRQRTERAGRSGPVVYLSPVAITALPFQERLLEDLALERDRGHHRNLLVSATGTGKTVMAALDYLRLRSVLPRARLLFVAHRQEILDQSQATFRHAMRDAAFGDQWIGGQRPSHFEHVFASIQSLSNADLDHLPPDHFDVVIIDEFHHAAAASYERLLRHLQPVELLGLTATPERTDGLPILHWFDDRIAAELRLWDAIDQQYLSPFSYYGIHDGLDLTAVPWHRGRGYDVEGLTNLYTANDVWAQRVVKEFIDHIGDPETVRALGFCVSVEHAKFMARVFNDAGIRATAISGQTPDHERRDALRALADGQLRVLFSVDLFNEGVDVPTVDALLMLRPTDSATLFLQQLGRGLRKSGAKSMCTVLDFVGQHRREFRFDRRLRALLGGTRSDIEHQVEMGFPYLPAGCHMELDRVASSIVLESIRQAVPSRWTQKVDELRALVRSGHVATMRSYLAHSGLELADLYNGSKSWSDLCEAAAVAVLAAGPHESVLRRAVGRLLHVDDMGRLETWADLLSGPLPDVVDMEPKAQRLTRMLVSQLVSEVPNDDLPKDATLQQGVALLWAHPQVRAELVELFGVLGTTIDHVNYPLEGRPDVPLRVHARYTRLEILAAFDYGAGSRVGAWQQGVQWLPDANADLMAFTLDKSTGSFSPTTRYRDYAISRDLIHWESQTITRAESETGQRYQHHHVRGSDVFLFARLRQDQRAFWFLGRATYEGHEGERPMAIRWRLDSPLGGDLYTRFAAAVA
jgi:superfamily II DNA or RNA helicase/HKD family nuclease